MLPKAAEPRVWAFRVAFSRPTFQRVVVLILGAILSRRRRTGTAMRCVVGPLARGHGSDFHRVLCRASGSLGPRGKVRAALILECIPPDPPVGVPVDDTTPPHQGQRVYGQGRHHDAIRSTHRHPVWVDGHQWVTRAINVRFPFASRPWALPALCALDRPADRVIRQSRPDGRQSRPRNPRPAFAIHHCSGWCEVARVDRVPA